MNVRRLLLFCGTALAAAGSAWAWQQAANRSVTLPPPFHTTSANNRSQVIERPGGAQIQVPQGFQVTEFASGFQQPRFMKLGPGNEVLLSDSAAGKVYVLVDKDNNFQVEDRKELITGLKRPYGMELHDGSLYVADEDAVRRYPYNAKAMTVGEGKTVVDLNGYQGGHWTRTVLMRPDSKKLMVGVGSRSNVDAGEPELRAAITEFNPDGSGKRLFATGTRNPIGLRYYPGTSRLYAAVQERDGLGDDLVPDYLTEVRDGGFYGWPFAYIGPNEDPRRKGERPDLVSKAIVPDVPLGAHVAVLDLLFYTGKQFPQQYQGGAFLAFHGSWNRSQRVGYSLAFVPFKDGRPTTNKPTDFLTGFMLSPDKREVWGRPVGLLQLADGSLLFSDDGGKKVWRIFYKG